MTKILIVDDDVPMTRILQLSLQHEGYEVRTAKTADEALEDGIAWQPDILVTDWLLRESEDGIFVAEKLLEKNPSMKVFFVTGFPKGELENRITGMSVERVFQKPMSLAELLEAISPLVKD